MMNKWALRTTHIAAVVLLTVTTQIGGIIYVIVWWLERHFQWKWPQAVGFFIASYLLITIAIVPNVAPYFGRGALPWHGRLSPHHFITCLLNRNYVAPRLKQRLEGVANKVSSRFGETTIRYLDANFPFFNGFPMLPHLSHDDGRKIDLAFLYQKQHFNHDSTPPGLLGYGVYTSPQVSEPNYTRLCEAMGYWQYGLLAKVVPQHHEEPYLVDVDRTTALIKLLIAGPNASKLFIEPHLKDRWQLNEYKRIRFHGCQAVRHDDHIHYQIQ